MALLPMERVKVLTEGICIVGLVEGWNDVVGLSLVGLRLATGVSHLEYNLNL